MSTHFVAAIIRRKHKNGVLEDLVIDSQPHRLHEARLPFLQTKYPGGRFDPDETPYAALKREVLEETGLKLPREGRAELVYVSPPDAVGHRQHFYLIEAWRCKGCLKGEPSEERNSTISNRRFEPVSTLYDRLYKTHRRAFVASIDKSRAKRTA